MECPICFYNWNPESVIPIILSCGHSICMECCRSLYSKGKVVCPSCSGATSFLSIKTVEGEDENSFKSRCIESLTKNYTLLNAIPVRVTANKMRQFKYGMKCKKHEWLIHSYVSKPFSMLCDKCLDDIRGLNLTVIPFPEVLSRCKANLSNLQNNIEEIQETLSTIDLNSDLAVQDELKKHFSHIKQQILETKTLALEKIYETVQDYKSNEKKTHQKLEENLKFLKKNEKELKKLASSSISKKVQQKQFLESLLVTSASIHSEPVNSFVIDVTVEQDILKVFKDFVASSMNIKIVDQVKIEKWTCLCGHKVQHGKVQCECERFRPIDSYPSIHGGKATPSEINEVQQRREIEIDWINKLDEDQEIEEWFLIDAEWVNGWKAFVLNKSTKQRLSQGEIGVLPPGPINNWGLLKENGELKPKLKPALHYRAINRKVWEAYVFIYTGGPEIMRRSLNIYDN